MQELDTDAGSATPDQIKRALSRGHTIDITTTGRRSGEARRIEIVFHNIDGRIIITGSPRSDRRRSWLYNLDADPNMTFHLKGAVKADLPATARRSRIRPTGRPSPTGSRRTPGRTRIRPPWRPTRR